MGHYLSEIEDDKAYEERQRETQEHIESPVRLVHLLQQANKSISRDEADKLGREILNLIKKYNR